VGSRFPKNPGPFIDVSLDDVAHRTRDVDYLFISVFSAFALKILTARAK
jgi:hypothetical protein